MGSVVVWWLALLCGCSKLASGVSEVSNSWDSFQDPCGEIKLDKLTILFLNRLMDTLQIDIWIFFFFQLLQLGQECQIHFTLWAIYSPL